MFEDSLGSPAPFCSCIRSPWRFDSWAPALCHYSLMVLCWFFFCQRITLVIQSRLSLVFSLFCSFFLHLLGVEIERSRMLMNINVAALLSPERVSLSLSACLAFRFCWWKGNYGRKSVEVSPLGWWGGGREPHANEPLININAHPLLAGESREGDMLSI